MGTQSLLLFIWTMYFSALSFLFVVAQSIVVDFLVVHVLQHFEEFYRYVQFGLWWLALGVASSIGLGKHIQVLLMHDSWFILERDEFLKLQIQDQSSFQLYKWDSFLLSLLVGVGPLKELAWAHQHLQRYMEPSKKKKASNSTCLVRAR